MAEITVATIKELRDKTNAGMMDCKGALKEADGDLAAAETILRKKGIADASKKASRSAKEGAVASFIDAQNRTGVLAEINCETDFVAKNDNFRAFVADTVQHIAEADEVEGVDALLQQSYSKDSSITVEDFVKTKIAELKENMRIRRFTRFNVPEGVEGVVASYIHMQGRVGVLVEVTTASGEAAANEGFRDMVKDITLHIAAAQPSCVNRDEVPEATLEAEKDIFRSQMKDKPDNIIEKIIAGKIDKFYSTICLSEQGFIKDPDKTIGDLVAEKGKELGEEIKITRFVRYAIGEEDA